MSVFKHRAVDAPDFDSPLVVHLIEVRVGEQVVIDLGQQGLGGHDDQSLWPPDLVVLVLLKLLSHAGDVLEGVEDWDEVGESLACPVVSVDNEAEVLEVVLQSDGQRLSLYQRRLAEIIVVQQFDHFVFEREVLEFSLFRLGSQVML